MSQLHQSHGVGNGCVTGVHSDGTGDACTCNKTCMRIWWGRTGRGRRVQWCATVHGCSRQFTGFHGLFTEFHGLFTVRRGKCFRWPQPIHGVCATSAQPAQCVRTVHTCRAAGSTHGQTSDRGAWHDHIRYGLCVNSGMPAPVHEYNR